MNRPVIYYHLWRGGEWARVNQQIFSQIVESGLADYMDSMRICVNDNDSFDNIDLFGLPVDKISFIHVKDTKTEWPTLELMYEEFAKTADTPLLYLHSKGSSYISNDPLKQSVIDWVDGLLYYLVEDFRKCLSMMRMGSSVVGANRSDRPSPHLGEGVPNPHYSGNFWWINSNALQYLPNPKLQNQTYSNRFGAESWIGGIGAANLKNNGLVGFHYGKHIPRELYHKPFKYNRSNRNVCLFVDSQLDLTFIKNEQIPHDVYRNGFNSYVLSYLEYIIDNYENLPEYNYFFRTSQIVSQCPTILDEIDHLVEVPFRSLSKAILTADPTGAPHHPNLPIRGLWERVYEGISCPESLEFGAGAQFVVSREAIEINSLDFYVNLLDLLKNNFQQVRDFCMERLWSSIFRVNEDVSNSNFDLQVFIFNYGQIENAIKLYRQFDDVGVNCRILNSSDGKDDLIPETDFIYKFDNIYYSGLWNEALDLFDGSHMMVITSDVEIEDVSKIVRNAKSFFRSENNWIYAPNVDYTFWKYHPEAITEYSGSLKNVPNTDGMCWMLSSEAAYSVGNIDLSINKIGFGVDLLAAMFATRANKKVVRDYSICVKHPQTRSYDSTEAERQEFQWINSLGYYQEYIQYRNNYAMSFLG